LSAEKPNEHGQYLYLFHPNPAMTEESRATFFRQSGWVALSTMLGGVFLMAVHMLTTRAWQDDTLFAEYGTFVTLLRLQVVVGVPAAGLQAMFARLSAAAITEEQKNELAGMIRQVTATLAAIWLLLVGVIIIAHWRIPNLFEQWGIHNASAVWVALCVGLVTLMLPVFRGVLTGYQRFGGLGWTIILDGVGRFLVIAGLLALGALAAGGMVAVLVSLGLSLALAVWLSRDLLRNPDRTSVTHSWVKQILPSVIGPGVMAFMFSADVIFVQSTFDGTQTSFYGAVATVGMAMFLFITPIAIVMFPKLVRGQALNQQSAAFGYAIKGTAVLGGLCVIGGLLLPKLPLMAISPFNNSIWDAAPLVTWYALNLFPLLLANVLISDLIARNRLSLRQCVVLVMIAATYTGTLFYQRSDLLASVNEIQIDNESKTILHPAYLGAFKRVIVMFGPFNLGILIVATILFWKDKRQASKNLVGDSDAT